MKKSLLLVFAVACSPVLRAEDKPVDALKAAAKKLGESSYTWTTTSSSPTGGNRGGGGGMEGKADKDGTVVLKFTMGDRTTETVIKGGKAAVKTESGWKSGEELAAAGPGGDGGAGGGGGGRRGGGGYAARMAETFKAPASEAVTLAEGVKELKKDGDTLTGELTEDAAKTRLTFGGRGRGGAGGGGGGGGNAPAISGAKGTVKFWVKDGVLSKYEVTAEGKRERDGNTTDINRTSTTEFKDVGTTKVEVPDEAKAKLAGAKPAETKPAETKPEEKKTEAK